MARGYHWRSVPVALRSDWMPGAVRRGIWYCVDCVSLAIGCRGSRRRTFYDEGEDFCFMLRHLGRLVAQQP